MVVFCVRFHVHRTSDGLMLQNFEKYEFIYRPTTLLQMNSSFLITLENQKRVQNPVKHLR